MKLWYFLILFLGISISTNAQSGLYLRIQYWGNNVDIQWLYFKDSILVRNPKYGINPLQLDKEITENRENVASVRQVLNNKMALKWGNGISQAVNIEMNNHVLSAFHGNTCMKAKPYESSFINDQTYTGLVYFHNISRDITLFLGKDGKFTYEKKDPATGTSQKEEGTYSISGNSIQFNYHSGKNWQALIHRYDLIPEDIIINEQLFKNRK